MDSCIEFRIELINSQDIIKVNIPIINGFDIGTLATNLSLEEEKNDNITKVNIKWINKNTLGTAKNFYKESLGSINNIYHHVGIYCFTIESLTKFVSEPPSSNELNYKLEQWRALDAKMTIGVSFVENVPLSVDTKEDLIHVESIIKNHQ